MLPSPWNLFNRSFLFMAVSRLVSRLALARLSSSIMAVPLPQTLAPPLCSYECGLWGAARARATACRGQSHHSEPSLV